MTIQTKRDDKISLLEQGFESLPDPKYEIEREKKLSQRLRRLFEYLGDFSHEFDPRLENIVMGLTREFLFEEYQGFNIGEFIGPTDNPFRLKKDVSATQQSLESRLRKLGHYKVARDEMFHWFLSALFNKMDKVFHERLRGQRFTLNPMRLFIRLRGRISWTLSENIQPFLQRKRAVSANYQFSLTGLSLLFAPSGKIQSQEFGELVEAMSQWVATYPYFPAYKLMGLIRVMALSSLSHDQCEKLGQMILSWRDMEKYPPERHFADTQSRIEALIEAEGYERFGPLLIFILRLTLPFISRKQEEPAIGTDSSRSKRDEIIRHCDLAITLKMLATYDESYFPPLLDELRHLPLGEWGDVEATHALLEALPAFIQQPKWLKELDSLLKEKQYLKFEELHIDNLQALRLHLSRHTLPVLLDLITTGQETHWIRQVLENIWQLDPDGEDWLVEHLPNETRPAILDALLGLHQRLIEVGETKPERFENALISHLRDFLPMHHSPAWIRWLLEQKEGVLLVLLQHIMSQIAQSTDHSRYLEFLNGIANQAETISSQTPVKLAVCWLVDPTDRLSTGRSLEERIAQALNLLHSPRFNEEVASLLEEVIPRQKTTPTPEQIQTLLKKDDHPALRCANSHPLLIPILLEGWRADYQMRAGAARRLVLVRTLARKNEHPDLALPILANAFQLAVELGKAWAESGYYFTEFYREAEGLAWETISTIASLDTFLPQAISLLETMLFSPNRLPERLFDTSFSPANVHEKILPLLSRLGSVEVEAVPGLLEIVERNFPRPGIYWTDEIESGLLVLQCSLQVLSKVSTLTETQQDVIFRIYRAMPDNLTRALSLLVLGRQRPLSESILDVIVKIVQVSPIIVYSRRVSELRKHRAELPYARLDDAFLVQGTAVALAGELLISPEVLISSSQRTRLQQTLRRAASSFNRLLEPHLTNSTHSMMGKEHSMAQGLVSSLDTAIGQSSDADPDWLVHPADLAYRIIQDLIRRGIWKGR